MKDIKKDLEAMGRVEDLLVKYGPVQLVDALRDCLRGWAETARDGLELDDEAAVASAEQEAGRLHAAADELEATMQRLRQLGL